MPSLTINGVEHDLDSISPEQMLAWQEECMRMFPVHKAGKYQVLYADCPWKYDIHYKNLQGKTEYPTLNLEALKKLPVAQLGQANSLIFMWATGPLLPQALELMQAWNYKYVSIFK